MSYKKNSFFDFKAQGTVEEAFGKGFGEKSIAQGTIEYLVIIAVVVVISLIVVALVLSSSNSSTAQLVDSSSQMSNVFEGSISASDLVIDSNGNALFKLSNLSGNNVTIKKVVVGGEESAYDDLVASTGERLIYLADSNTNCVCGANQKNTVCIVEVVYVTRDGLEKKETRNLTIDCVNITTPSQPLQVSGFGSGTIEDPFVINSCKELQRMNQHLDGNYVLGGDINCYNDTREGGALYNGGLGFAPVGTTSATKFTGNFNGSNYIISNLFINRPSLNYVGLFGYATGEIKDVGLVNVSISGSWYVGGLVGYSKGLISNSYSTGKVSGSLQYAGGLVGACNGSTISNSYSTGTVTGSSNVGGLVGYSTYGSISNSYSTGKVSGSSTWVGGLVGYLMEGSTISNSYSTGDVNGSYGVGGLVSYSYKSTISNSYSTGDVNGSSNVGGLAGYSAGGSTISNSYYDSETSGLSDTGKGEPKTTAQMKQQATYENWDFVDTWEIDENVSYPILSWQ